MNNKKTSKQPTLFQSWGHKKTQAVSNAPCPQPSTSAAPDPADVIDLSDFDDGDDDLLCEAEESASTSLNKSSEQNISGQAFNNETTPKKQMTASGANEVGDECNISFGAAVTPTQSQCKRFPGFDRSAGKLWIYPTNYPVRDYQYNIVQQALFKNTMVTLPTGLGKTFIAAVVMYNFYRWYPQGKVVFMAPTKPLVAQQIEACYNIMGIPQDHTSEMTGSLGPGKRERAWKEKRVFFLTPQVLTNDLSRGSCPAHLVKCLVIDEAHKAQGNHAYCQVVRELVKYCSVFRVLALSATPGSDIKAVQQVLTNLLIAHIEIRTEDCIDIKQYSHQRTVDKVVVPLGEELSKVKDRYIRIMDVVVSRLKRHGVLYNRETTSLSKFLILKAREAFRQNPPERLPRHQFGVVEGDFALAMSLYHGYELLQLHGSRSLHNFLDGIVTGEKSNGRTKTELRKNGDFNQLMEILTNKYKAPEGVTASQAWGMPFITGHPKMDKLQEIVLDHFNSHADGPTRVMIFSQYRDSVQEITDMLHKHSPLVKVMSFIGQASAGKASKGFTQKEQLKVMKQFREGGYNTLVSTCVGEEGLDIGDVDLIICFDAHKSPIRLVQRMGRTGRKREGRIVMLVTQGKEEQIYNQSQYSKRSIHKAILNGAKSLHFYQNSPRMVPEALQPACHKMHITVKANFVPTRKLEGNASREGRQSKASGALFEGNKRSAGGHDEILTLEEYLELEQWLVPDHEIPKLPDVHILCLARDMDTNREAGPMLSLEDWSPWQSTLQDSTERVDHSVATRHLAEIMQFVQLQQSVEPGDDPYGLEMAAYLNNDDVNKPGEASHSSILKFCKSDTAAQNEFNPSRRNHSRSSGHTRKRLSDALPKFDISPDHTSDSDEDLPRFAGNTETSKGAKLRAIDETGGMDSDDNDGDFDTGVDLMDINEDHIDDEVSRDSAVPDFSYQSHHINADPSAIQIQNTENIKNHDVDQYALERKMKGSRPGKGKKVIKSKAKTLEQKMNETKTRKRKRSKQISGQRSIVELIVDSDSNDFDGAGIGTEISHSSSNNKQAESIIHTDTKSCENGTVYKERLDDSSIDNETLVKSAKQLKTKSSVNDNGLELAAGSVRIRTPPTEEDARNHCEALDRESIVPKLDLLELIDEWHRENVHGKYIVYPEGCNPSQAWQEMSAKNSLDERLKVRESGRKCSSSVGNTCGNPFNNSFQSNNDKLDRSYGDFGNVKDGERCVELTSNNNGKTSPIINNGIKNVISSTDKPVCVSEKGRKGSKDIVNSDLSNGSINVTLFSDDCNADIHDKEMLQHGMSSNSSRNIDIRQEERSPVCKRMSNSAENTRAKLVPGSDSVMNRDEEMSEKMSENLEAHDNGQSVKEDLGSVNEEDWIQTGTFAMGVDLLDDENDGDDDIVTDMFTSPMNNDQFEDNLRNSEKCEKFCLSDKSTTDTSSRSDIGVNKGQRDGRSRNTNGLGDESMKINIDETNTLKIKSPVVKKSISSTKKTKSQRSSSSFGSKSHSSVLAVNLDDDIDDDDDNLFMAVKTPAINKTLNTSTQITFTQALDFVHSGTAFSNPASRKQTTPDMVVRSTMKADEFIFPQASDFVQSSVSAANTGKRKQTSQFKGQNESGSSRKIISPIGRLSVIGNNKIVSEDYEGTEELFSDDENIQEDMCNMSDEVEQNLNTVTKPSDNNPSNMIRTTGSNHSQDLNNSTLKNTKNLIRVDQNTDGDSLSISKNVSNAFTLMNDGKLSGTGLKPKGSSSSESGAELPEFDLGFDIDDIIPPSPEVLPFQKASTVRLSQAHSLSSRLSQSVCAPVIKDKPDIASNKVVKSKEMDNERDANNVNGGDDEDRNVKIGSVLEDHNNSTRGTVRNKPAVPKSKKSLNLGQSDKSDNEGWKDTRSIPLLDIDEESQSLLDEFSVNDANVGNSTKRLGLRRKSGNHRTSERDLENKFTNKAADITNKMFHEKENIPFNSKCTESKQDDLGNQTEDRTFGDFETSFSLLDDDWLNCDDEANQNSRKTDDGRKSSQKKQTHSQTKLRMGTPVATVAPLILSQGANCVDSETKVEVAKKKKVSRKSVFEFDDLSPDFMDDSSFSFNATAFVSRDAGTPSVAGRQVSLRHSTSTPVGNASQRKVHSVPPFNANDHTPIAMSAGRRSSTSEASTDLLSKSDQESRSLSKCDQSWTKKSDSSFGQKSDQASIQKSSSIGRLDDQSEGRNADSSSCEMNHSNATATDEDSFIVVRKKKKVAILDSPLTQRFQDNVRATSSKSRTDVDLESRKTKKKTAILISSDEESSNEDALENSNGDFGSVDDDFDDDFDDSFMMTQNNYLVDKTDKNGKASFIVPEFSSEDDDFDESVNQPKGWLTASKNLKPPGMKSKPVAVRKDLAQKKKKKRIKSANPFIEEEAELSEEDENDVSASSDESEGSHMDQYENSFIQDSQFSQANNTDIHALYLKSVKSPVANRGGFKLQYAHRDVDVYSQAPPQHESHYMEDSFCVGSEGEDDWLLGDEKEGSFEEDYHDNEEYPREVTMLNTDNSIMKTGRKARRKGGTSFLTSRQRSLQQGRMKALDKIRSKLAKRNKTDHTDLINRQASTKHVKGAKMSEKGAQKKKTRIHVLDESSSEDEPTNVLTSLDKTATPVTAVTGKKRARVLLSSDESEEEDSIVRVKGKCARIEQNHQVDEDFDVNGTNNGRVSVSGASTMIDVTKMERLKRQKERQEEFRRNLELSSKTSSSVDELTRIKEKRNVSDGRATDSFRKPSCVDDMDDSDIVLNTSNRSKFKGQNVIIVDSRELNSGQDIISDLRFKHGFQVNVAQLDGCDYVLSNRMAVERKQWSDFGNGANKTKLIQRLQELSDLYDRPCILVEKDKVKGDEKSTKIHNWTKYIDRTVAQLIKSQIQIVFSENNAETAQLLVDLCNVERRKNMGISVPVNLNDEQKGKVKFYLTLPKLSYIHALNLCYAFRTVSSFLAANIGAIEKHGKMSKNRATDIYNYIHREFDENMLPSKYK